MHIYEEMRRAAEAAPLDRLGEVTAAVWKAYGAGGLTDAEAEELDGLLSARRGAARVAPVRVRTLADASAQVVPAATPSPAEGGGGAPTRDGATANTHPHHRTGSRPRKPESLVRRRRWTAGGYLPPALAASFTPGEQAVLAVVALEVGKRGTCTLAVGHIAALAGVCATVVKRALRLARTMGLVTVEERRLTGFRNDTNVVRVASREWAAWLRLRLPRASHAGLQGGGGISVPTTITGGLERPTSTPWKPGQGPVAGANLPPQPAARVAGA